jgi:hypothetical protein
MRPGKPGTLGAFALLVAVGSAAVFSARASATGQQAATYGFLVNGGHLYLPYMYIHWTDRAGRLTGTEETLETSNYENGYVIHRHRFTGHRSSNRLFIQSPDGHVLWGTRGGLRFVSGRLYLRESQTGAVWWAPGKAMPPARWALAAVRFMECYTNPYQAGTFSRKCTNHG